MITRYVLSFLCAGVLVACIARLTVDLLTAVWQRGYHQGRKDASDYWLGLGKDVKEMQREIRYEEEA